MTDGDSSDLRGIMKRRFLKLTRCAGFARAFLIVAVFFLMLSSLSLLLGPSDSEGPMGQNTASAAATGSPPTFKVFLPSDITKNKGEIVTFTIYVNDTDNDNVNVTWDFGDGSPFAYNTTLPAFTMQQVRQTHLYDPYAPGQGFNFPFEGQAFYVNYSVNVSLDDGNGNSVFRNTTKVHISIPENGYPSSPTVNGPTHNVDPADTITITANASDPEGDELWWTFVFNNTQEDFLVMTNHTPRSAPSENMWANESLAMGAEGSYSVTVFVCDAPPPYQRFPHNLSDSFGPWVAIFNRLPNATDEITASPSSPIINATLGYVEVMYSIDAFDLDGDVLNLTWDFGDGTNNETNLSAGGTGTFNFQQVRNYTVPGDFNINITITDGRPGHEIHRNLTVNVQSTNRPPNLKSFNFTYATGNFALPNETLNFTLRIADDELDPIEVIVDWGDGSPMEFYNLTDYVEGNVTLLLTHSYREIGKYNISIWYTDHKIGVFNHSKNLTNLITVNVPLPIVHHYWSWWDFTSLGLFCLIPVLVVARFVQISRHRKMLETEGLTLEEWKLMQSELGNDAKKKEGP
jgi:hypothetical protein